MSSTQPVESKPESPAHAQAHPQDVEADAAEELAHEDLPDQDFMYPSDQAERDNLIYGPSSPTASTSPSAITWINWYVGLSGHEYFCEVAEEFIEDDFNLTGLTTLVPFYKEAMEMVLDIEVEEEYESHGRGGGAGRRVPDVTIVETSAELLYGLVHQRFILTKAGISQMMQKYEALHFGVCPRVYCHNQRLLPVGRSDLPGVDTVKLYCASCLDLYNPPSTRFSKVDGAYFGTTFPHLFYQTYPNAMPEFYKHGPTPTPAPASGEEKESPKSRVHTTPLTSAAKIYIPRIYGFKVSERAKSGPRMGWMRMRPTAEDELDWSDNESHQPDINQAGGEQGEFDMPGADSTSTSTEEEEEEEEEQEQQAPQQTAEKVQEANEVPVIEEPTRPQTPDRDTNTIRESPLSPALSPNKRTRNPSAKSQALAQEQGETRMGAMLNSLGLPSVNNLSVNGTMNSATAVAS